MAGDLVVELVFTIVVVVLIVVVTVVVLVVAVVVLVVVVVTAGLLEVNVKEHRVGKIKQTN